MRTGFSTELIQVSKWPAEASPPQVQSRFVLTPSTGEHHHHHHRHHHKKKTADSQKTGKRYTTVSPTKPERQDRDYFADLDTSNHKDEQPEYDPLALPADWELAKKHAMARRTAPDKHKQEGESCKVLSVSQTPAVRAAASRLRRRT